MPCFEQGASVDPVSAELLASAGTRQEARIQVEIPRCGSTQSCNTNQIVRTAKGINHSFMCGLFFCTRELLVAGLQALQQLRQLRYRQAIVTVTVFSLGPHQSRHPQDLQLLAYNGTIGVQFLSHLADTVLASIE
jgi:hypothetical protein